MRGLLVLYGLGEQVARAALERKVDHGYVDAWLLDWEQAVSRIQRDVPGRTQEQVARLAMLLEDLAASEKGAGVDG
jgi:hypothetical protein